MFDIDFSSKRVRLALRFFTYGVMTVATLVISTIMIFFALGYRIDKNFNFTQGGLVQFRSFPDGSSITIDGALQGFRTPGKANLNTGHHTAEMSRDGYRSWSKGFDLAAGQLLWFNYVRLIPNTIETSNVREFDSLAHTMASPNREWMLLQPKQNTPQFALVDLGNEKEPKFTNITLPDGILTKKADKFGTFTIVEWDLKSQYVLIQHQNGDTREFIRFDRSKPAEAVNITREFGLPITEAHFSGSNPNILFANTNGVLRRLDLGNTSASGALVNNLRQFVVYGEGSIAFTNDQEQTAGDPGSKMQTVGIWRNNQVATVRTLPLDKRVAFDYSEYDDHRYLAIATTDSSSIEILRDPGVDSGEEATSSMFAQFNLGAPVRHLAFSNNGRMLVAQNGNTIASHDIEESRSYQKTLNFGTDITEPLEWLDDFYLWSDAGGKLRLVEFDGANERDITGVKTGYSIMLSSNGKRLFSIGGNDATHKLSLQASQMTIDD